MKRKDVSRLARQLVDAVDQLRVEMKRTDAELRDRTAENARMREIFATWGPDGYDYVEHLVTENRRLRTLITTYFDACGAASNLLNPNPDHNAVIDAEMALRQAVNR